MTVAEELIEIFLRIGFIAGAAVGIFLFGAGVFVGWLLL